MEVAEEDEKKKKKEKKDKKAEGGQEELDPNANLFGELQTYIYLRISVDPPVVSKYEKKQPTL